jgi:hypothetical protein
MMADFAFPVVPEDGLAQSGVALSYLSPRKITQRVAQSKLSAFCPALRFVNWELHNGDTYNT